jgi:hypothetical protein
MFETHKLNDKGLAEVTKFKTDLVNAVEAAFDLMPDGREKSVFKTKLEEAVFFGTKAIAGKAGNFSEIITYETKVN